MCPKCDSFGATFLFTVSQKWGAAGKRTKIIKLDKLAECLCESAIKNFPGRRIRTDMSDGDRDWDREEDFYILRKSWCPAGKQAVVDTHVEGIVEWLESSTS